MKICPRCGSEKIKRNKGNWLGFLGLEPSYTCENCDYTGKIFLEIDRDKLDEAKETIQENAPLNLESEIKRKFNKTRAIVGIIFLLMGIPLLVYSPLGGNFFIGAVSSFIGVALLHTELKKMNI